MLTLTRTVNPTWLNLKSRKPNPPIRHRTIRHLPTRNPPMLTPWRPRVADPRHPGDRPRKSTGSAPRNRWQGWWNCPVAAGYSKHMPLWANRHRTRTKATFHRTCRARHRLKPQAPPRLGRTRGRTCRATHHHPHRRPIHSPQESPSLWRKAGRCRMQRPALEAKPCPTPSREQGHDSRVLPGYIHCRVVEARISPSASAPMRTHCMISEPKQPFIAYA